ncbi:Protein kinase dsk1 [Hordeum vulgare]|nr:Protein kinase dsk1 [Hordeum vulgare]
MHEGVLHSRDDQGPKEEGSEKARLATVEREIFKCQGMVEHGLSANHSMITDFIQNKRLDTKKVGEVLFKLLVRVDPLQDHVYERQSQNSIQLISEAESVRAGEKINTKPPTPLPPISNASAPPPPATASCVAGPNSSNAHLRPRVSPPQIRGSPARWLRLWRASRWEKEAESRHFAEEEEKAAATVDGDGDMDNNVYTSEDEGTENYGRDGYHVVRPGDNFKQGTYVMQSNLAMQRYVALKVQKSAQHYSEAAMDEIKILRQIADGDLEDSRCVVKLLDHFKHTRPNGSHVCMVFEFLGDNLLTLIKYTDYRGIPLPMVKEICRHVLIGLDYLHRELSIIHTDLKPKNIFLVSTIDPSNDPRKSGVPLVPPAARAIEPPPRAPARPSTSSDVTRNQQKKIRKKAKHVVASTSEGNGAVAFADIDDLDDKGDLRTSNEGSPSQDWDGKRGGGHRRGNKGTRNRMAMEAELGCKLVDFGNACWTYKQFTSDIQTRQYRCPEVLLGSKYSTSVDLWSFACGCFELASGDVLFDPHSGDNFDRDEVLVSPHDTIHAF